MRSTMLSILLGTTAPLGPVSSVMLKLSFNNGTNGNQDATDESPEATPLTWVGASKVVDGTSVDHLGLDINSDAGSDDYITVSPIAIGANDDFTIELWCLSTSSHNTYYHSPLGNYKNTDIGSWSIWVRDNPNNVAQFSIYGGPSSLSGTTDLQERKFYHIAVTRTSGIARLFVDGVMEDSDIYTSHAFGGTGDILIGGNQASVNDRWRGWLDLIRIVKGEALYDSDASFTPPTYFDTPAPAISVDTQNVYAIHGNPDGNVLVDNQVVYALSGCQVDNSALASQQIIYIIEE